MCSYASLAAAPLDAVARDIIELHSGIGRPANDAAHSASDSTRRPRSGPPTVP
jgi:hypothetical protein